MIAHNDDAGTRVQADGPRLVVPTRDELRREKYDSPNVQEALEALHQDGLVVLKSVIDPEHIRLLREYMSAEADELVRTNARPFNQGVNSNILQCPPLTSPGLLFNDVYFNPFVIQIMNAYLGPHPSWGFVTSNTALPKTNGLRQPVHKDIDFFHPQCPFYVIANVPLCRFNKNSGSTEFWLGSHAHTSGHEQVIVNDLEEDAIANSSFRIGEPSCKILPEVLDARRATRPPIQPDAEPGDFILRDLRTWHAGMPNETDTYRTMIALGYQAPWYENHALRAKLPLSQANFFMKHGGESVEVRADLLPDDADFGRLNDVFSFRHTVNR